MKDKLLEFGKLYEEMRKEALRIVEEIKPKVQDMTDAQIVQSLREKKDFYWKHDLSTIKELANKYKIKISKLNEIWEKYVNLEQKILEKKKDFEQLGLKDITFGPKSISASGEKDSQIYIYIDLQKQDLDIRVYPEDEDTGWTEDFEKFASELKDKIKNLLQKDF